MLTRPFLFALLILLLAFSSQVLRAQSTTNASQRPSAPARTAPLERFDFMLGLWKGPIERGNLRHVEAWTWQNDSTLIAEVFTERRHTAASQPTLAADTLNPHTWVLRADGRQVMLIRPPVDPADGLPVRYNLVATGPRRASFTNPDVAYPQQITYELTLRGELLIQFTGRVGQAAKHGQQLLRPSH